MKTFSMRSTSLFHTAALFTLALAIPSFPSVWPDSGDLPLLLTLCTGLLVTLVFTGTTTAGTPLNMFPFLISLATRVNGTHAASLAFAACTGLGSLFLLSRLDPGLGRLRRGTLGVVASLFLLCRILSELHNLMERIPWNVPPQVLHLLSVLVLTAGAAGLLRFLPVPVELRTWGLGPVLFNLAPVPMILPILNAGETPEALLIPMAGAVFWVTMVQVGTYIVSIRRSALEKSLLMERSLAGLTSALASVSTVAGALKILLEYLLEGSGASRVQVLRGNLSLSLPVRPGPSTCTVRRSVQGLTVIMDFPVMPMVSPERVDAFLTRTAVMVEWIRVSESIARETWESIEALLLSLERTDRKTAGFSKQVAETITCLAERMGYDSGTTQFLRIAALLHSASGVLTASGGGDESWNGVWAEKERMHLPPVTMDTLKHHGEYWDGTGPLGLSGEAIPLGARMLAVCIGWERALGAGGLREARRAMSMGRGTLYDPALVDLLVEGPGAAEG